MHVRIVSAHQLREFAVYLHQEEKSKATCEKYLRDVRKFEAFAAGKEVDKELVSAYKKSLIEKSYAPRSVNSMLASVNSFLGFLGWQDCRVRNLRLQHQAYCAEEKELTRGDYLRLLKVSEEKEKLNLLLQTICATGIRVSELQYFTVESVRHGEITVNCKGKTRRIFVPGKLKKLLLTYAARQGITAGTIFRGRNGTPMDRSSIWRQMKQLCRVAGVQDSKVFPHNLRHLFARTFYALEKDIAKLADILGHSSIDTTRLYIITSGAEHRRKLERMQLIL